MSLLLLSGLELPQTIDPKATGCGWGAVADELGFRLTSIRNGLVPGGVDFVASRLGAVVTMDAASRTESVVSSADLVPVDFDFDDPDAWFVDLQGDDFNLTLRGIVEQDAGVEALKLRPKLEMAAFARPTRVFRGFRFEFVLDPAALGGTAATTRIMIPGMEQEVRGWNDAIFAGAGRIWCVPGQVFAGGEDSSDEFGDTGHLPYDDPKGELAYDEPATTPEVFVWHNGPAAPDQKTALLFRLADHLSGAARLIRLQRDLAGRMTFSFTYIAQDCSTGTDGKSDTDFADALQIRTMVGEDYDALRFSAEREIAEGYEAWEDGAIGANPKLSQLAEKVLIMGYASGALKIGDFQPYRTCFKRLFDRLGCQPGDMAVQVYEFQGEDPGTGSPRAAPFQPGAADVIKGMHDDGLGPVLYEDIAEPKRFRPDDPGEPTGPGSGLHPDLQLNGHLTRTRPGYTIPGYGDLGDQPISGEGPSIGTGSDEGDAHYGLTYLDPAANAEYIDAAEDEHTEIAGKKRGDYCDTWGLRGPPANDDFRLQPEDRGPGATTFIPAVRAFHDLKRQRLAAKGVADPALLAEFANGYSVIGSADLAYVRVTYPPGGDFYDRTCLGPQVKYGRLCALSTYRAWPAGPGPEFAVFKEDGWATSSELFHASFARWWLSQLAAPMQYLFQQPTPEEPGLAARTIGFVREPGEAGYDDYVAQAPFYDFVSRLYIKNRDLVLAMHRRGKRLRELQSSMQRRAHDFLIDGVSPLYAAAKLGSMITHLEAEDCVVGAWTNWSRLDGHPQTVEVTDQITLAGWPEMGAAVRDAFLLDLETQEVRQIRGWAGATYTFSDIHVEPGAGVAVLFVPAGQAPPFVSFQRGAPTVATAKSSGPIVSTWS